jgi:hypothetical protein
MEFKIRFEACLKLLVRQPRKVAVEPHTGATLQQNKVDRIAL